MSTIKTENIQHPSSPTPAIILNSTGASSSVASHLLPLATNTYDLGSAVARWRNVYTQDLHLNNGIGNYTIIEGEENLYIVNNKTQKYYKFNLTEVDPSEVPSKMET